MSLMLLVACFLGGWMANDWIREKEMERITQSITYGEYPTVLFSADPKPTWLQRVSFSNILLFAVIVVLFATWQLDRLMLKRGEVETERPSR